MKHFERCINILMFNTVHVLNDAYVTVTLVTFAMAVERPSNRSRIIVVTIALGNTADFADCTMMMMMIIIIVMVKMMMMVVVVMVWYGIVGFNVPLNTL